MSDDNKNQTPDFTNDACTPIYRRLGVERGTQEARDAIIADLTNIAETGTADDLEPYLTSVGDGTTYINDLKFAYIQTICLLGNRGGNSRKKNHQDWYRAEAALLLKALRVTRSYDHIIQYLLNMEDFALEIMNEPEVGVDFIISVYELRGLDFYLCSRIFDTDANKDTTLFEGAETVVTALRTACRNAEAEQVERKLASIKSKLVAIERDFVGPDYDPSSNLMEKMKIASEKFWADYLTTDVWARLLPESRLNLTDAYSYDYLLRNNIFSDWTHVSFAFCKVAEREVARVIYHPWRGMFSEADWSMPRECSKTQEKKYATRIQTLTLLKKLAGSPIAPTLGQLGYIGRFWHDQEMDELTELFKTIRRELAVKVPNADELVATIAQTLNEPLVSGGTHTLVDVRNNADHPSADASVDWVKYTIELKRTLGEPPRRLLHLVCADFSPIL